jgi:dTDP-4-dehydrorhamnose reductase
LAYSVLVTDASVIIGQILKEELSSHGVQVTALGDSILNQAGVDEIYSQLESQSPDLVINTFGWSDTGEQLLSLPVLPVGEAITNYCSANDKVLLQLSNYRVFSGTKSGFLETDETCPRDACGKVFTELEELASQVEKLILLRLSWVVGAVGENLMTSVAAALWNNAPAKIHAERRGAPIGHSDIARIITAIVKQVSCGSQNWGIFHYSSADVCTEEELAEEIYERLKTECNTQGSINDISDADANPYSAALGYRRLMDNFGVQPRTWRQGLNLELTNWVNHKLDTKVKA